MRTQKIILFVVALAAIGIAAGLCAHMQTSRKLGNPGVKIVSMPSFDVDGKIARQQSVDLPARVLGFDSRQDGLSHEELRALPSDTLFGRRTYRSQDFYVTTSVVVMGDDSRSIHKPEICLPAQGWEITEEPRTIHMLKPVPYDLPVVRVIGSKTIQGKDGVSQSVKTVFVYWFVAEDEITADHLTRMWKMGKAILKTGTLQRWAYIAFIAHCYPGQEEETYQRIEDFIIAAVPKFQTTTGQPSQASTASELRTASQ